MELSHIILASFIVLLVIVIYGLGRKTNQYKARIEELEADLQEHIAGARQDARTITRLQRTITELSKEKKP